MSIKAKLLGVSAAALAIVATSAIPASAQTVGVIVFDGTTSSVTCAATAIPPTVGCSGSGIPYVGGTGAYSFNAGAAPVLGVASIPPFCLMAGVNGGPSAYVSGSPTPCKITSSGTYTNIVCGTGTATGSATIISPGSVVEGVGPANFPTSVSSHTIVFVSGVGVLVTTSVNFTTGPAGDGAGVVVLIPADTGSAPGGPCVNNFSVLSAIAAAQA